MWAPPGQWKIGILGQVRLLPDLLRVIGARRLPTVSRGLGQVEKAHPKADHWYLATLGTEPAAQGKGVGSALMAPVLARCDNEGVPAYLESSKERNVPFYRRHGFEVTGELVLPDGPRIWEMWREPRPPESG
jgi:GNAT superfamily N-acetyltransferase